MLYAKDLILKSKGETVYRAYLDIYDVDDVSFMIDLICKENATDMYAVDIEQIVSRQEAFNEIAKSMALDVDIIYKVKGMFR